MAKITINKTVKEYPAGTPFETIVSEYQAEYGGEIGLVTENGKIRELHKTVSDDAELTFITLRDSIGHKSYERSATMLFVKALSDVVGCKKAAKVKVEFTIGKGIYCTPKGEYEVTDELVGKVNARMKELVEKDIPIIKKSYPIAVNIYAGTHTIFKQLNFILHTLLFKKSYRLSNRI